MKFFFAVSTIMWKHNQLFNIVQSFQFMPLESIQNNDFISKTLLQGIAEVLLTAVDVARTETVFPGSR